LSHRFSGPGALVLSDNRLKLRKNFALIKIAHQANLKGRLQGDSHPDIVKVAAVQTKDVEIVFWHCAKPAGPNKVGLVGSPKESPERWSSTTASFDIY